MKKIFLRNVQRTHPNSIHANIPKQVSKFLDLQPGSTLVYSIHDGIVEIKKATI